MDWDDLRLFLGVTRARNLADAARALGADASTLSRRVAALERALGTTLFLRTREGLRLSADGERLRAHVERVEAEVRAAALAATSDRSEVSGLVRLATTEALTVFLVERGLCDVRAQHPDLTIELLGGNAPVALESGAADIALRVTPPRQAGLRARRVIELEFALYASADYLRGRGLPRSESDLAGHDVLLPGGELAALPDARWLAARPGVRVVLRCNNLSALVAAASRGLGLVVLSRAWGDREPRLERLFVVESLGRRKLWLVIAPDARSRAAVRVVADKVVELLLPYR